MRFSEVKTNKMLDLSTGQWIMLLLIGLIGGLISGGLGVGGGVVIIPALVFIVGMTQHQAQGAFIGMIVFPVSIFAAYNYYKAGNLDLRYSFLLMITFVIGSYLGSYLANTYISDKMLQKIFGIIMLLTAIKMIFSK